jgi:VIT1/CCC1 family predicted Fe2+/Mn2+ transporter
MTLTFTLGAGLVIQEEGRAGAREMLVAILGCNLAWGLIDGVFYVLGQVFERGRLRRIGTTVRQTDSDALALQLLATELDETLAPLTDESERRRLYSTILQRLRATAPAPNRVRREDLLGGLASGWLVFACSIPAVIPFALMDDPERALRISNAILIGLLFLVGHRTARFTMAHPWVAGSVFALVGIGLVLIAIALGG